MGRTHLPPDTLEPPPPREFKASSCQTTAHFIHAALRWSGAGAILPISGRASGSGQVIEASLLDAGETATELELLRALASGLSIVWGWDDLGAWAVVPNAPFSAFAAAPEPPSELPHALYREDDNGARFLIARYATQAEAEAKAAELARGGHKQGYFVERARMSHQRDRIPALRKHANGVSVRHLDETHVYRVSHLLRTDRRPAHRG